MHTFKKVLPLFALILLVGGGCSDTSPKTTATYENTDHAFRVEYPLSWEKEELGSTPVVRFFSPLENDDDTFSENINIITQDIGGVFPLDQYVAASLEQLENGLGDFTLLESEGITVDGIPGQRISYTGSYEGLPLKFTQWIFVRGTKDFILTYTAEESSFDIFFTPAKTMADSLHFSE